jgi:DNA mismatch endonuclease (patch repair protein)
MDTLTTGERSRRMGRIRGKDTGPEKAVRSLLHRLGYRFRLHYKTLPGRPDIVFPRRKKVIFVHGCFWHRHPDPACRLARLPKTRLEFWLPKLEKNQQRDHAILAALSERQWQSLVIWECELKDPVETANRLVSFLAR